MNDDELTLITQVVDHDDHHAFATLLTMHQRTVRQWLFRLTKGDQALTDDLAQETFLRAYQSLSQFQQTVRFSTWLYRIAYNIFVDYQRRFNKTWLTFSDLSVEPGHQDIATPFTPSDAGLMLIEQQSDIAHALSQLQQNEQWLIQMHYYFELSHQEIHFISNIPLGTVKSTLRRSLAKLKALLSEDTHKKVAV